MKYSFFLDKPKSKDPTFIFIAGTFGDRLKYSLKEKIHPDNWDPEHSRPLPSKDKKLNEDLKALKAKLDRIANRLDEMIRESKRTGKPLLKGAVEAELDVLVHKKISKDGDDFYAAAEILYKEMEDGTMLTGEGKRFAKQTLTNYEQSLRVLKEFKPTLKFSEIDMDTYRGLVKHMNAQSLSLNSAGCHIKCFKRLLSVSFTRGWHTNPIHADKDFRVVGEQTDDVYLDEEELTIMYNKKLLNKGMELARDWFIVDAYSGLRISDIQRLNDKENLSSDFITIANEKTDAKVIIPLHPRVREIIKKYKGLPPRISDQEINREIKKVAELCKINKPFLYVATVGGKRKETYYKKYEVISNHTARRSFITNLRKQGVPDTIVMKLTGIKKPQTLSKYDKLSSEEAANIAAGLSFFKK